MFLQLSFSNELHTTKNRNQFEDMTEINKKDSNASFVQQLSSYGVSMPVPRGGMKRNVRVKYVHVKLYILEYCKTTYVQCH